MDEVYMGSMKGQKGDQGEKGDRTEGGGGAEGAATRPAGSSQQQQPGLRFGDSLPFKQPRVISPFLL